MFPQILASGIFATIFINIVFMQMKLDLLLTTYEPCNLPVPQFRPNPSIDGRAIGRNVQPNSPALC